MILKPLGLFITARLVDAKKLDSGIVLPDTVKQLEPYGLVLDVGEEVKDVAPGDKIAFHPGGANTLSQDGPNGEPELIHFFQRNCVIGKFVESGTPISILN